MKWWFSGKVGLQISKKSVLFSQVLEIFNVLLLFIFKHLSFVNTTEQSFTLDFNV